MAMVSKLQPEGLLKMNYDKLFVFVNDCIATLKLMVMSVVVGAGTMLPVLVCRDGIHDWWTATCVVIWYVLEAILLFPNTNAKAEAETVKS
jgi:hypothetical protein